MSQLIKLYFCCVLFLKSAFASYDVSPSYVDFYEVEIGDTVYEEIVISNEGESIIFIDEVSFFGDSDYNVNSYCPALLSPGKSCFVTLELECEEFGDFEGVLDFDLGEHGFESVDVFTECR